MKKEWQRAGLLAAAVLVVALAGALRVWGLPRPPDGPYYDEAANGILAASIADESYRPIFITAYTGKEVLYFYLVALVMKLLGAGLLALRLTSAILGTLTVGATLWCVRELYADRAPEPTTRSAATLSLLTAALLATSFWHLVLSRVGLRAVAQPLLQALTLALLWRGLRKSSYRLLAAAGVCLGLTGYTYLAARLFPIPLGLALVALLIFDRAQRRPRLAQVTTVAVAAGAVFAPLGLYFLRNPERFTVRIDQLALQPGLQPSTALTLPQAMLRALGALFVAGDPIPRLNLPGKPIFGPLLAAAFLLGLALTVYRLYSDREPLARARGALLLAWIPVMILPTALTVTDIIPNHLRAAGLLPMIYVFPALFIAWVLERASRWPWAAWLALAAVLGLTAPFTVRDYFVRLAERTDHYEISDGDLADMAEWLNAADLADTTTYVASVHYRHPTLAFLAHDYAALKWLSGGNTLVAPARGSALILVPRSIDYHWADPYLDSAVLVDAPNGPDGSPAFSAFRLEANTPLTVDHTTAVDYGHIIQLEGYDISASDPGSAVEAVLLWRVLNPPPRGDYQFFGHLRDTWGLSWGETLPFHYPSEQWTPGERFLDRIRVALPPGTPPGEYTLYVGLYSPGTDSNLTVVGEEGRFAGLAARLPVTLSATQRVEPASLDGIRRPLDVELAPGLRLLGVNLDTVSARTREPLFLTLFWQAEASLEDHTVRLRIGDLTLYEGAPVHGTYPTSVWVPEAMVADRYNSRLPLDTPVGDLPLVVEVVAPEGQSRFAELGTIAVSSPQRSFVLPEMQHSVAAMLGEHVELLGYDATGLDSPTARITLYWRALREMERDLTVYVHLLAADGSMAGQSDSMPQGGAYATSMWAAGEVVTDHHEIAVPQDAARPLSLEVGMYLPVTGEGLGEPIILR